MELPQWEAILSSLEDAGENDNRFEPLVLDGVWGDENEPEPAVLEEVLLTTFVNANQINPAGKQDHEAQDEHESLPQHILNAKPNDEVLDQSFLPDVASTLVQTIGENSEELEFLDHNRLESAILGRIGNGTSDLETSEEMHVDRSASLLLEDFTDEQDRIQNGTFGGPVTEDEQMQVNSLVDLDTNELLKAIASLDLTTMKDPPVYLDEVMDGAQNPDPIISSDFIDQAESDEDDEPKTQSLDVALQQSHQEEDEFVQGAPPMLQVDDELDDPICSISVPVSDVQQEKHHDHEHIPNEDPGFLCQEKSSTRREAWDAAQDVLSTFGLTEGSRITEQQFDGHKETIFGLSFSECGSFCATASQDATIKMWDVQNKTLLASLEGQSKDFEWLRVAWASSSWSSKLLNRTSKFKYVLAAGGADGTVQMWACQDPRISPGQEGGWRNYTTLDHSNFPAKTNRSTEAQDKPQIYTLQFIDHWEAFDTTGEDDSSSSFLMTSSDDYLHFWSLDGPSTMEPDRLTMKEVISLHFASIRRYGYGVRVASVTEADQGPIALQDDGADDSAATKFGGDRNPNNVVYVFDASFCPSNGLVGVALSDGTLRLINGRGICVCILNIPNNSNSHLTSCVWDKQGSQLVTTVATGQLVSWKLRLAVGEAQEDIGYTKADHVCTFEGGHEADRPLFGARYYGGVDEELLLSWSADGSLCLWDSRSQGHVKSPIAVLRHYDHSIYAVEVHTNQSIAVGGTDNSDCRSHGVALYLYDPKVSLSKQDVDEAPLSPKATETSETFVVVSPPSSPTLDFDDLVQQIEAPEGLGQVSELDPLDWELGEEAESLVLDDDELAALWDIGDSNNNSFEKSSETPQTTQSPAAPTEQVPEPKSPVEEEAELEPNTSTSQKKESQEVVADETKTEDSKEQGAEAKEESVIPQQEQRTDGLPPFFYCQPISPTGSVDLPPPQEETKESPTPDREQLLDELASLDLGSLAQLVRYSDQLKGSDQDNLLGILEEVTGVHQTEENLLNLDGEELFAELNDLGFGGVAEIGWGASNGSLPLICQPCTPKPTDSTTALTEEEGKGEPIEPAADAKEEQEPEAIKPTAPNEETEGEESTNPPGSRGADWKTDESKIEARIRTQQQKLDNTSNPAVTKANRGDSMLQPAHIRPQLEDFGLDNMQGTPLQISDARRSDSEPRIVELKDEIDGKPNARKSDGLDGPSQPGKKPRPVKPGSSILVKEGEVDQEKIEKENKAVEKEKAQNEETKAAESVSQQAALQITSQMFKSGRIISVKEDSERAKSPKQEEESKRETISQQPAPSKNEAFLARLREIEKEAEAKKKAGEDIQEQHPVHVTDLFKGCQPCIPSNFRIISTREPEETISRNEPVESSSDTKTPTPTETKPQNSGVPATQSGDTSTMPAVHPQLQDSIGGTGDTADPAPQNPQAQQQDEEQGQQYDGHEEHNPNLNPARPEAWDHAGDLLKTFGLLEGSKTKEQSCFGHKEKIFGVSFSECGNFCASASQDSCVNVWDVKKNTLLASLKGHSKDYECLRVVWASSKWSSDTLDRNSNFQFLLASSSADGTVRLWACKDPRIEQGEEGGWKCCLKFDHGDLQQSEVGKKLGVIAEGGGEEKEEKNKDKPQVYSLQFIDHWQAFNNKTGEETKNAFFMTSSDNYVHYWELEIKSGTEEKLTMGDGQEISLKLHPDEMKLKEVFSLHFGNMNQYYYGVEVVNVTEEGILGGVADRTDDSPRVQVFGGERNPDSLVYVFDASYCSANGLLGVALSDGSLRLHNAHGHCVSVMNLPGMNSHLTSFAWDRSGERLVTTVATGHLISWHLHFGGDFHSAGSAKAECIAIMEGGHEPGRPIFGAKYLGGEHEHLIVSWGVDGSLCLWDSYLQGNVNAPMAILKQDGQYPIYAVDVHQEKEVFAVAGGTDGGFIGTPLYLYNYKQHQTEVKKEDRISPEKKKQSVSETTEEPSQEKQDREEMKEEIASKEKQEKNKETASDEKQQEPESETKEETSYDDTTYSC
ncbi:MAG: hypothetical protein SGBAC_001143 [Bacillariaceae sp.]